MTGVTRPPAVTFTFAGRPVRGHPGESVAAALIAVGMSRLGEGVAAPCAAFCLMGTCQQCLVRADGRLAQACLLPVREGLVVTAA